MLREPLDDIALGIDFGTSECRAVVATPAGQHELRVPGLVSVDPHGRLVAGDAALAVVKRRPELGVRSIKRLLGRRVGSPEIAWLAASTPQQLEQTTRGLGVQLGGVLITVPALAQVLLRDVVEKATYPATPEGDVPAVLTIPAMFDLPQRMALVRVARQAGIGVRRIVESPVAALAAMSFPDSVRRVAVADFGAGYFDVCVASRTPSGWTLMGSEGDPLLGTDDLDHRVVQLLIDHFYRQNDIDLSASSVALARLRRQARQIRQSAHKRQPGATVLTNLATVNGRDVPLVHPAITAPELDALWDEELGALVPPCLRLFEELGLGTDDIDALVLLGGAARLPFVQARFQDLFRLEPIVPADAPLLAARGAVKLASGTGPTVKSVLPHTLSVLAESRTPVPITQRNQPLPITSTHFFKPDDPHGGPIDLWLCQGEREHDYDAFRVARAHLEHAGDGSYVVTVGVSESGDVAFHVQSAAFGASDDGPGAISSIPPMSEDAPLVDVIAESLDQASLDAYIQSLEQEEDDLLGGQPTVQARRLEPEDLPASSRPEHALRRSMYGRGAVIEIPASRALPHSSTQIDQSAPTSLRSAADPLVGTVLGGRYEVTAIIGEGAMARVYKARHKILGNAYAVKVMHAALASDASLRERFLREARAAAAIDSDHVVRILDFGNADDSRDYFVMEFLEGRSLEDEIQEHLVPMPLVLTAMVQVARGLEAAHQHAIVHRDLKPENVWLTHSGAAPRVKILDFGVAKIPTAEAGLTMGNSIIGTPYYMAPEQVSGQVDHRTDIYATGIMLYELVTGRVPFHHESLAYVLAMQCDMPLPSPRAFAGPMRCSEELDALIRKCADKNKDQRFQSARELRASLEEIRARLVS